MAHLVDGTRITVWLAHLDKALFNVQAEREANGKRRSEWCRAKGMKATADRKCPVCGRQFGPKENNGVPAHSHLSSMGETMNESGIEMARKCRQLKGFDHYEPVVGCSLNRPGAVVGYNRRTERRTRRMLGGRTRPGWRRTKLQYDRQNLMADVRRRQTPND